MWNETGVPDEFAVFAGAAIADGRFIGVQFHHGIVHAGARQGGQHMFHRVNAEIALAERGGTLGFDHVVNMGLDLGFGVEVHAAKPQAAPGRRRQESHVHAVSAVQADTGEADRTFNGLLL